MFFVSDNEDTRPKRAFGSIIFDYIDHILRFPLVKRLGIPFGQKESYAKCMEKVSKLIFNNFDVKDAPCF